MRGGLVRCWLWVLGMPPVLVWSGSGFRREGMGYWCDEVKEDAC